MSVPGAPGALGLNHLVGLRGIGVPGLGKKKNPIKSALGTLPGTYTEAMTFEKAYRVL